MGKGKKKPKLPAESTRRRRVTEGVSKDRKRFKGTRSENIASKGARSMQVRQEAEKKGGVRRRRGL